MELYNGNKLSNTRGLCLRQLNRTIEDLLLAYQQADPAAFDEFYRRTHPILFNYLQNKLKNQAEAEDCLHDTFLKIHTHIRSYDPAQNALSWIFTITKNVAIDHLRKNIRRGIEVYTDIEAIAEDDDKANIADGLASLINELSPEDQKLIEGRFITGYSYQDLAIKRSQTPSSLRQQVSRILRKLRSYP